MTDFRRLTGALVAAMGLIVSASQVSAQQPDRGDEPGLVADDAYELDPEWQKQVVYFRTTEAPGTIYHLDLRAPPLSGAAGRARDPLRHRRRT
ncbi:hypothetical protein ACVWXO_002911 [Bradyrhizobium sp. LM2.7]